MNPTMTTEPASSVPTVDDDQPTAASMPAGGGGATDPVPAKGSGGGKRAIIMLVLGFAGGLGGAAAYDQWIDDEPVVRSQSSGAVFQPTNDESSSSSSDDEDGAASEGDGLTPREVYQRVSPAVAHIDARVVKTETNFFGFEEENESEGTGSGFIIDDEGHIVTNAHVIQDADEINVSLGADNVKVPAKVIGTDPSSDIAVIKFDPDAEQLEGVELATVPFGDSAKLQVGDPVLAIGNPFGLDRTLTTGVVSALQREIPSLTDFQISDVIQTDAAVNPGNSGGPLLDSEGRVIGVNSQIQTRSGGFDGIAFAVPSSRVQAVAKDLVESGEVRYAWLGVAGGEITPELVKEQDLPVDEGVLLGEVTEDSPADKAGLRGGREVRQLGDDESRIEGGDIILEFDGTKLTSMRQLADIVDSKDPGDKVKVVYLRGDDRETTTITLGERPDEVTRGDDD